MPLRTIFPYTSNNHFIINRDKSNANINTRNNMRAEQVIYNIFIYTGPILSANILNNQDGFIALFFILS